MFAKISLICTLLAVAQGAPGGGIIAPGPVAYAAPVAVAQAPLGYHAPTILNAAPVVTYGAAAPVATVLQPAPVYTAAAPALVRPAVEAHGYQIAY